jgi:hypothetical protein
MAAVQQAPGISRTDLQQHDLSIPGHKVIQNRVDLTPEAPFVRHKHPGEEIIYVLEGSQPDAVADFILTAARAIDRAPATVAG